MKSKKLVALAMAAVMSVSALGFGAVSPQPVGITASAAKVEYADTNGIARSELTATATFTKAEIDKLWSENNAMVKLPHYANVDDTVPLAEDVWVAKWAINTKYPQGDDKYYIEPGSGYGGFVKRSDFDDIGSSYSGNYKLPTWTTNSNSYVVLNTSYESLYGTYTFLGWSCVTDTGVSGATSDSSKVMKGDWAVQVRPDGGNYVAEFQAVVKVAASDEEREAAYEAEQKAAAEAEEKKKADDAKAKDLDSKLWAYNAVNNAVNSAGKVETRYAQTQFICSSEKLKSNYNYTVTNAKNLFNMVNLADDEIGLLFDIHMEKDWTLLPKKNARVLIETSGLDKNYDLSKYRLFIYHLKNGKVYAVGGINKKSSYLTFAANDFSPYVVVLAPRSRKKRDVEISGNGANPPTADASSIPVMLLAAASLSAAGSVIMRRKREEVI